MGVEILGSNKKRDRPIRHMFLVLLFKTIIREEIFHTPRKKMPLGHEEICDIISLAGKPSKRTPFRLGIYFV